MLSVALVTIALGIGVFVADGRNVGGIRVKVGRRVLDGSSVAIGCVVAVRLGRGDINMLDSGILLGPELAVSCSNALVGSLIAFWVWHEHAKTQISTMRDRLLSCFIRLLCGIDKLEHLFYTMRTGKQVSLMNRKHIVAAIANRPWAWALTICLLRALHRLRS